MRSERTETNYRCNQNCTYCTARRSTDEPRFVRRSAVEQRIGWSIAAATGEADGVELLLTGGEPTLRQDLPELVRHGKAAGARKVTLETNATLLDGRSAQALFDAGLDHAVVNLSGPDETLDRTTRDPGGFARTLAGIEALLAAGVEVTVRAVLVRSTMEGLSRLPAFLVARFGRGIRALELMVPVTSPDPSELLDLESAARCIEGIERQARRAPLPLKLAPGSGPPPCLFPHGIDRVSHLFSLSPGAAKRKEAVQVAACAQCSLNDRCAGIPGPALERFGLPKITPIQTERARRRLSLVSTVEEQIERELVTPSHYRDPVGGVVEEDIIRVVFACNQACRFCFVSTHLPGTSDARIEEAIRSAARNDHKVTLSGGEPTLHPRLTHFVRLAKSLSRHAVLLQTNAVRLGEPERSSLAAELKEAGLDEAFVSLHGATAEVSDKVTEAPGTFERTLAGLDALTAAGVGVQLNFVISEQNAHQLPAWVELVFARWPRAFANVSFVAASTDVVPREAALVPRYADILPHLSEAVTRAEALGLAIGGFESMCGIPLCLVPAPLDRFFALAEVPPGFDRGEFLKPAPCQQCALAPSCWGVRRGYVELHGDAELKPVPRPD